MATTTHQRGPNSVVEIFRKDYKPLPWKVQHLVLLPPLPPPPFTPDRKLGALSDAVYRVEVMG